MEIRYTCFYTAFGWCGLIRGNAGLLKIFLPEPEKASVEDKIHSQYPLFSVYAPEDFLPEKEALGSYFSGGVLVFPFSLDFSGATAFQKAVWNAIKKIPYGQVRTYQWVSKRIKHPHSMRAVGNALGRNPFPPVIPCHRVIRGDGLLGGFSAPQGLRLKVALLELEGIKLNPKQLQIK
jgi:methylated-DNA-[protein]-cysteine S-methyltransferase